MAAHPNEVNRLVRDRESIAHASDDELRENAIRVAFRDHTKQDSRFLQTGKESAAAVSEVLQLTPETVRGCARLMIGKRAA